MPDTTGFQTKSRGTGEIQDILEKFDKSDLFDLTGMPINHMYSLNKLLWIKKNKGELLKEAKYLMLFEDYILFKLCGKRVIDYSVASRTMFFDKKNKKWADKILKTFGIEKKMLSKPQPSGTIIDVVSSDIVDEIGIPKDMVLIVGAHDQVCAAIGAGIIKSGDSVDGMGTSECITTILSGDEDKKIMLDNNLCVEPYGIEEKYITLAFNSSAGAALKWYIKTIEKERNEFAKKSGSDINDLLESELKDETTSLLVLPYLAGTGTPDMNAYASGVIIGLKQGTDKAQIYKAFIEGVCFEILLNYELLEKAGIDINNIVCTGGLSSSDVIMQIKADIIGKQISRTVEKEAGTIGLAILCSIACGDHKTIQDAVKAMVKIEKVFEPNMTNHNRYMEKFQEYKGIRKIIMMNDVFRGDQL